MESSKKISKGSKNQKAKPLSNVRTLGNYGYGT